MRATPTSRSLLFRLDPSELKWGRVAQRTRKSFPTLPMRSLSFQKVRNRHLQSKAINQTILLHHHHHHHHLLLLLLLLLLLAICFWENRRNFQGPNGSKKSQHLALLMWKENAWKNYRYNRNRSCFPLHRLALRSRSSSIAVRNQKSGGIPNSPPPNRCYRSNRLLRLPPNRHLLPKPNRILLWKQKISKKEHYFMTQLTSIPPLENPLLFPLRVLHWNRNPKSRRLRLFHLLAPILRLILRRSKIRFSLPLLRTSLSIRRFHKHPFYASLMHCLEQLFSPQRIGWLPFCSPNSPEKTMLIRRMWKSSWLESSVKFSLELFVECAG